VRSVTAQLRPGRVCALIGPNAAGKSTLLKLILGQLDPQEGTVQLIGRQAGGMSPRQRAKRVSYVPQAGAVSFSFSVGQVVEMGRYALGDNDDEAVQRALTLCDLTEVRGRAFAHLSGGQQRRVLLARAMAQSFGSGRVMLLDEPAAGMDLWHVHQTMRHLQRLASEGLSILVVMHDINLAASYADDVWLMDGGGLVKAGPWDAVLLPELLEPVYGVCFTPMNPPSGHAPIDGDRAGPTRPVFWIDPAGTMHGPSHKQATAR
jgi:ABC-type hemin transport system ATPase subunit